MARGARDPSRRPPGPDRAPAPGCAAGGALHPPRLRVDRAGRAAGARRPQEAGQLDRARSPGRPRRRGGRPDLGRPHGRRDGRVGPHPRGAAGGQPSARRRALPDGGRARPRAGRGRPRERPPGTAPSVRAPRLHLPPRLARRRPPPGRAPQRRRGGREGGRRRGGRVSAAPGRPADRVRGERGRRPDHRGRLRRPRVRRVRRERPAQVLRVDGRIRGRHPPGVGDRAAGGAGPHPPLPRLHGVWRRAAARGRRGRDHLPRRLPAAGAEERDACSHRLGGLVPNLRRALEETSPGLEAREA